LPERRSAAIRLKVSQPSPSGDSQLSARFRKCESMREVRPKMPSGQGSRSGRSRCQSAMKAVIEPALHRVRK
jgi:hypothetical protein